VIVLITGTVEPQPGDNSLIIIVFGEEKETGDSFQYARELADRAAIATSFLAEHPPCLHFCHGVLDVNIQVPDSFRW
jgi:hypothetical protein